FNIVPYRKENPCFSHLPCNSQRLWSFPYAGRHTFLGIGDEIRESFPAYREPPEPVRPPRFLLQYLLQGWSDFRLLLWPVWQELFQVRSRNSLPSPVTGHQPSVFQLLPLPWPLPYRFRIYR